MNDHFKDECGVVGFYDNNGFDVAKMIYIGLFSIQHRGETSCGIVTDDNSQLYKVKNMGLVSETFTDANLATLKGKMGIGHVRYAKPGSDLPENVQPIISKYCKGSLTVASNGNITNSDKIKEELENKGSIFQSGCDSEIITHLLAMDRISSGSMRNTILKAMSILEGAYTMIVMSPNKMFGFRDPHGYRPLCIGKIKDSFVLASESVALDCMGAEFIRDVLPGELVLIDKDGLTSFNEHTGKKPSLCSFEYTYFSRPDSNIDGVSVYLFRLEAGKQLFRERPVDADVVIGVPSSGLDFALGYSLESGIPFGDGLIKNVYLGRGKLKSKIQREVAINIKLNVLKAAVKGKKIVLVDDSVVRGTTMTNLTSMMRDSGAKEVHVRIACPPIIHTCYYGAQVPESRALISSTTSVQELQKIIGCDSLAFLSLDGMLKNSGLRQDFGYCSNCLTGKIKL